jgi:MFS family permease
MAVERTAPPTEAPAASRVGAAVTALCLVQFIDVLGVTVVVTALPHMLADVHTGPSAGSLVVTGYAMFFGGLLMFGARLGDRVGHRRCILASLAVFGAGATLGAVAPSIWLLTAARCVQGAAAATAVPSALRLLTTVSGSEVMRRRALAAWSAAGAAAGASGFVVGGVVAELASWRLIFWGYVPLAVGLAVTVARTVPSDGAGDPDRPLNVASSALLTAAVMATVVGATGVAEPHRGLLGGGLLVAAVVLSGALVAVDRRSAAPLLPGALLRQSPLRRGATGSALNTATTTSVATLVTLYLQDTLMRSPLSAAAILFPLSVAAIAGSAAAAPALRRLRPERVSAAGLATIAAGVGVLIATAEHVVAISACMAAAGFGIGLSSVAANSLGTDVPEEDRAAASGLINTTAQLGTALGIAALVVTASATDRVPGAGTPPPSGPWGLAAAVAALGAVAFAVLRSPDEPGKESGLRTRV